MTTIAPIQFIAVGFGPDAHYEGRVLAALGLQDGNGSETAGPALGVAEGGPGRRTFGLSREAPAVRRPWSG